MLYVSIPYNNIYLRVVKIRKKKEPRRVPFSYSLSKVNKERSTPSVLESG